MSATGQFQPESVQATSLAAVQAYSVPLDRCAQASSVVLVIQTQTITNSLFHFSASQALDVVVGPSYADPSLLPPRVLGGHQRDDWSRDRAEVLRSFITTTVREESQVTVTPQGRHRRPPVGFELETNCFQFYAIANLDTIYTVYRPQSLQP